MGLGYDTDDKDNFQFIKKLKEKNFINKELFVIDKLSKKLVIGQIPEYLLDIPKYSCALYYLSNFGAEYRQSWTWELYKVFFGIYKSTSISISIDKDGNVIPYEELSIDFDVSKDVFGPAIFDSSYPYIGFPKKLCQRKFNYKIFKGFLLWKKRWRLFIILYM